MGLPRRGNVMRLTADGSVATASGFNVTSGGRTTTISEMRMEFNGEGEATTV